MIDEVLAISKYTYLMDIDELQSEADAGSTVAQGILGVAYLYGRGVNKDFELAFRLLKPLADVGTPRPAFHIGRMYEEGWGVENDFQRAFDYYEIAADKGEWLAFIQIARIYRYGRGVVANYQSAFEWYAHAVATATNMAQCPELDEAHDYVRGGSDPQKN